MADHEVDLGQILLPMAGAALLILMMLMVSAPAIITKSSVKVRLPKARVLEAELEENIAITYTKDGKLFLNDKPIALDTLMVTIRKLEEEDKEFPYTKLVLIRADEMVKFGKVSKLLEIAKKAGARRVAFAVVKSRK
jgi:biopolymer transport protein ExbD